MIIDFHSHLFPDAIAERALAKMSATSGQIPSTKATLGSNLEKMIEASVDISVVMPVVTNPSQFLSVNEFAGIVNGEKGFFSFGGIHPDCDDIKGKIRYIRSKGLAGIKLHPDFQNTFIDDEKNVAIIREAVSEGLFVLLHSGVDIGIPPPVHNTPERALKMLEKVYGKEDPDDAQIIFAHSGAYMMSDDVIRYLSGRNIYFDISYTIEKDPPETTLKIIRSHSASRILFGTDTPWSDSTFDVRRFEGFHLPAEDSEKILWKNAAGILGAGEKELHEKSIFT